MAKRYTEGTNYEELKAKLLKNPQIRKEYEVLKVKYKRIIKRLTTTLKQEAK